MHDLSPLTALGGTSAQVDVVGNVTISEIPDVALASVAARSGAEKACGQKLKKVLGTAPPEPGCAVLTDPVSAVWMAADQWMLWAPHDTHEDLAGFLLSRMDGTASVTEQNDAWVCFDLTGISVVQMFERLCPVPVRRLCTGAAQRTTIDHLGCFLIVAETGKSVRIFGPRSSAGSLHHALVTAAHSIA